MRGLKNDTISNDTSLQVPLLPGNIFALVFLDILLFILIVCGNILTILAVRLSRRLRHVISNYLILNLAISDLLVGLTLPYDLAFYFSETLNKIEATCILRFVLISLACCASVFNVSAIAVDRYIAIIHPFNYSTRVTKKAIFLIISIGWISSIAIATVPVYWNNFDSSSVCEEDIVLPRYYIVAFITPIFFIVWLSILTLYIQIWKEISHVRRLKTNGVDTSGAKDRKNFQVVLLIVGCFSICWIPYLGVACSRAFDWYQKSTPVLYNAAFSLAMANSGMNPMIYAWKNSNFRKAFQKLLHFQSPNHEAFNSSFKNYLRKHNQLSMKEMQINKDGNPTQDGILRTVCDNFRPNSNNKQVNTL